MREMHHNEARPVNCDGGRSSMKVQNQVRVWLVGQRTSSWHITDMWDRSVSKPISIDGKMANLPFLERDEERVHTDGLARRPRYIRAWLVDRYHHYMLGCHFPPFSGINVYFIRDKKIRVQTLHHAVLVVVRALHLFVKSNNDGTPHVGYYSVCL